MVSDGPFAGIDLRACEDETLPTSHVKILSAGTAHVFCLDLPTESSTLVATWPENG